MADEKTENTEEPEATPVEETPVAEETPAAEAEAPAEEAPAEEAPAAEADERPLRLRRAPAAEADEAADEAPAASAEEAPAAPAAPPSAKERKIATRAKRGKRRISDPEERAADRKAKAAARTRYRTNSRARAKAKRAESPAEVTPPRDHGPGRAKVRQGTVVSDKADKTITVRIDTARRHRRYEKIVRSSSTLHAHDEANEANAGDVVTIEECRPLSRLKRWKLVEVLERAK